jgi:predicted dienelactone hydrolase
VLPGTAERTLRLCSPAEPSPAITALCRLLREQNASGPLAGTIDMQRIVLVGHSAGGREALVSANQTRHPG